MSHIPRILVDQPLAVDTDIELTGDKAHHLGTVLRLKQGAPLRLFNGDGHEYQSTLSHIDRKSAHIHIEQANTPAAESPLALTLVQGIARGDRMDFAVAKAVELGVHAIHPVFTARGKVKLNGPRLAKKQAHWQRVADSAAEQSGRLMRVPVAPAQSLTDYLAARDDTQHMILDPTSATGAGQLEPAMAATLLVGPESGFSDAEITAARDAGCRTVHLGPRVLRTETAGMTALAMLQTLWGDLS